MRLGIGFITMALLATVTVSLPASAALDTDAIARAAGTSTTMAPDGVVRIGWSRGDVAVTVDGMPFKPQAGLGSWAGFKETADGGMVMGDTVVFQDEVDAAMDAAFTHGIEITALHNHFMYDNPKVYFMHIGGRGSPTALAAGVKAMWDAIKSIRAETPTPRTRFDGAIPSAGTINAGALESIIGAQGKVNNGVVKISIGGKGRMNGTAVGGSMGLSTWAAFSGSDGLAAMDGDFMMTAGEVTPTLRALRAAGIHVVSLHNHMLGGEPAFYFVHFWGKGPADRLARGFKAALDAQAAVGR